MAETTTPDNTEESVTQVTPDNTEETSEERQDLAEVGKNFDESKRASKLAEKEANRYSQFIEAGEVNYDGIKQIYRGNKISDLALEKFCENNGLDVEEVKNNIKEDDRVAELERKLEELQGKLGQAPEPTVADILSAELATRGISNANFLKYRDEFEEELGDLADLPTDKAVKKALNYVMKERSPVKMVKPDAKATAKESNIWTEEEFINFFNKNVGKLGTAEANRQLEAYKAERRAKGEPFFK